LERCSGSGGASFRTSGSHRTLRRDGWLQYRFAYHDKEELGPVILAEIAKEDL
jgi:predicted RNA binding protein YcfA (HicA-like mRNA interferase family)